MVCVRRSPLYLTSRPTLRRSLLASWHVSAIEAIVTVAEIVGESKHATLECGCPIAGVV